MTRSSATVDPGGSQQVGATPVESYPSSTFRFVGRRAGEPWMSEDLDGVTQAVLILRGGSPPGA
jgi:hypothetical protein